MADNYLEKQMDDYRNGRLGRRAQSRPGARSPLRFAPSAVLFRSGATCGRGVSLVSQLKSAGCSVLFTDADAAEGRRVAGLTGAMFVTADEETADVISRVRPDGFDYEVSLCCHRVEVRSLSDSAVSTVEFSEHTDSGLIGQTLLFLMRRGIAGASLRLF